MLTISSWLEKSAGDHYKAESTVLYCGFWAAVECFIHAVFDAVNCSSLHVELIQFFQQAKHQLFSAGAHAFAQSVRVSLAIDQTVHDATE